MSGALPPGVEIVAAADYPAVLRKGDMAAFLSRLKSSEGEKRGQLAISTRREELRGAVLRHVQALQSAEARFDPPALYAEAHEIRGIAETAGLNGTGRIANGLCLYLDALADTAATPDRQTVKLHVEAIALTAHSPDAALCNRLAEELSVLALKRLEDARARLSGSLSDGMLLPG